MKNLFIKASQMYDNFDISKVKKIEILHENPINNINQIHGCDVTYGENMVFLSGWVETIYFLNQLGLTIPTYWSEEENKEHIDYLNSTGIFKKRKLEYSDVTEEEYMRNRDGYIKRVV